MLGYALKLEKETKINQVLDTICRDVEKKIKIYIPTYQEYNPDLRRVIYGLERNPTVVLSSGENVISEIVEELRKRFIGCFIEARENNRYIMVSWE